VVLPIARFAADDVPLSPSASAGFRPSWSRASASAGVPAPILSQAAIAGNYNAGAVPRLPKHVDRPLSRA